jgi:3-dehydroquinate synthase
MRTVNVGLGDRSYPILIGNGLLERAGSECAQRVTGRRCVVISDTHVAPLYSGKVLDSLKAAGFEPHLISVQAGETAKSLKVVQACYDQLAELRTERKSLIIALGGGVVGDLAGFIAATYMRGIPFIQIPTTLLSHVDSSVGGKVGVNLKAGKNLVGAFYQPKLVLCDLDALRTLPSRELAAGLAEVIKYGVIYDAPLFARLESEMSRLVACDTEALAPIIARCCEIKADVVGQDETESGLRAILNFGHTVGHAIEATAGYGKYLHGEAVAIGSVAAAQLSAHCFGMPAGEVERVIALFRNAGLPTGIKLSATQRAKIMHAMTLDKKAAAGEIKFVLARRIGQVEFGQKVPSDLLNQTLEQLSP